MMLYYSLMVDQEKDILDELREEMKEYLDSETFSVQDSTGSPQSRDHL